MKVKGLDNRMNKYINKYIRDLDNSGRVSIHKQGNKSQNIFVQVEFLRFTQVSEWAFDITQNIVNSI